MSWKVVGVTETRMRLYYGTTTAEGAGTGIIVSKNGYVMTNNHVIEDATNVAIIDNSENSGDACQVIGCDFNDIAF